MKLVNPEKMKSAELGLVNSVSSNLDWGAVKALFKERHHLDIGEAVETKGAALKVVDNRIRYSLTLAVDLSFAIELDREGNLAALTQTAPASQGAGRQAEDVPAEEEASLDINDDGQAHSGESEAEPGAGEVENWLEEEDESAQPLYEDALKELGSIDRP